jgi:DNA-binding PadR family transcriptional regulator
MTNAELAILTLVAERPRHGYEIEQVIEERGMREWTEIGFSSIYYLLKKLEGERLIEGQLEEARRGPARKVYHLTLAGRDAVRAGVLDALAVPRRCYPPLQLGLANLPGISNAEALAALRQYRDALADRLEQVRATWERQRPLPYFVEAMFDHTTAMLQAEQEWIQTFIAQLEEMGDGNYTQGVGTSHALSPRDHDKEQ